MKKIMAFVLLSTLIFTLALPVIAANEKIADTKDGVTLSSIANEWFVSVPFAGTVIVKDNKNKFDFTFNEAGTYSMGLQKVYTGQLSLVSFTPNVYTYYPVYEYVAEYTGWYTLLFTGNYPLWYCDSVTGEYKNASEFPDLYNIEMSQYDWSIYDVDADKYYIWDYKYCEGIGVLQPREWGYLYAGDKLCLVEKGIAEDWPA